MRAPLSPLGPAPLVGGGVVSRPLTLVPQGAEGGLAMAAGLNAGQRSGV